MSSNIRLITRPETTKADTETRIGNQPTAFQTAARSFFSSASKNSLFQALIPTAVAICAPAKQSTTMVKVQARSAVFPRQNLSAELKN